MLRIHEKQVWGLAVLFPEAAEMCSSNFTKQGD